MEDLKLLGKVMEMPKYPISNKGDPVKDSVHSGQRLKSTLDEMH